MNQTRNELNKISINPYFIAYILGFIEFLLVLADIAGHLITYFTGHDYVHGLIPLFDLDREHNFPTYYASFLLLFSSLIILIITILERNRMAANVSKWAILSFCFLCMATDEALSFHEKLVDPVRLLIGKEHLGIFFYSWIIPGIITVILFAIFFRRFFLGLNQKTKFNFSVAGSLYVFGAIGMDIFEGRYVELYGRSNLPYNMMVIVEESLEMAGIIVFIFGLMKYISDNFKNIQLKFIVGFNRSSIDTNI